jgi:hypothetical protein
MENNMRLKNKKGSVLITLIIAMVLMAVLGIGIYGMTTSSNLSELLTNRNDNAYQLAKAGIRYAVEKNGADLGDFLMPDNSKKFNLAKNGNEITSTGIVNEGTFLEARRVIKYTLVAAVTAPPNNNNILIATFTNDLSALDLSHSGDIVLLSAYVATGGTHMYWAGFQGSSGYYSEDPEQSGCQIGYHVVPVSNISPTFYRNALRDSWLAYSELDYDAQAKVGWDLNLQYGVTGLNFRWHESAPSSGKYEGYGLSFMRYNTRSGCSGGYTGGDGIPNGIKPPGLSGKSLLVLWRQKVVGGVETKKWLAYAELGDPYHRDHSEDPKVVGNQGWPDGIAITDNASLNIRVEDTIVDGQHVNNIKLVYGDGSPNYDGQPIRNRSAVATNIQRGRYSPEWIDASLFPRWPSNKFDSDHGTIEDWLPDAHLSDWYDYFTLVSKDPKEPNKDVKLVVNDDLVETGHCHAGDVMCLLDDKATIQTRELILDAYEPNREEIGLHSMGYLGGYTLAFDDFVIQILGVSE